MGTFAFAYFTRFVDRGQRFEAGRRPEALDGPPSQRAWRSFQSQQKRENPILVADRFLAQYRAAGYTTYAELAAYFGVCRPTVTYYMALLTRLPADFVEWLRGVDDPRTLDVFTERQLRPITRMADRQQQGAALRALREEAGEASIG